MQAKPVNSILSDFTRALTRELPGKSNAGIRAILRASAVRWATSYDTDHDFAQAIRITASHIALSHTGRAGLEQAIAFAEEWPQD